jgi:hypothetical protein
MELETFGEPACESEVTRLDGQYSRYYFHHTEFTSYATDPRTYLFIGRRGSGKTALTQYFNFQTKLPRAINIAIDEPAAFQGILDKLAARTAYAREIAIPDLAKLWRFVFWFVLFRELRDRDARIKAACIFGDEPGKLTTFIKGVFKQLLSKKLDFNEDLTDQLEQILGDQTITQAQGAVLEFARNNPVILSFDSLENYSIDNDQMMKATASLIQAAAKFNEDYASKNLHLKLFMMAEIYPYLREQVLLNPLKHIRSEIFLRWRPKDLMRLLSWRLRRHLKDHNMLLPTQSRVDWDDHDDVLYKIWEPHFGRTIQSNQGPPERTFTYVLRHTQMRPRQVIVLCNSIARHAQAHNRFPQPSAEDILAGARNAETRLVDEVFNSYSSVYPNVALIAEALSGFPQMFTGNLLDKAAPKTAALWPNREYSPYRFRQLVAEIGAVGRVRRFDRHTGIVEADFEYGTEQRLGLQVSDDCVVHPMFYRKLNIATDQALTLLPFPDHPDYSMETRPA